MSENLINEESSSSTSNTTRRSFFSLSLSHVLSCLFSSYVGWRTEIFDHWNLIYQMNILEIKIVIWELALCSWFSNKTLFWNKTKSNEGFERFFRKKSRFYIQPTWNRCLQTIETLAFVANISLRKTNRFRQESFFQFNQDDPSFFFSFENKKTSIKKLIELRKKLERIAACDDRFIEYDG